MTDVSPPDRTLDTPLYLQLYQRFQEAIRTGRLKPGDRVPAIRNLASELNLARGTVETAYQLLISEGYLEPRGPAGTVVSPRLDAANILIHHSRNTTAPSTQTPQENRPGSTILPFQLGLPALDAFPHALWRRLTTRRLRELQADDLNYPDPLGYRPLREHLSAYLSISRGIHCAPEQLFITAGCQGALSMICHCLMKHDDQVWFEDPGYHLARRQLEHAGARLIPVPVDEHGLDVDHGQHHAPQARFAVVTPSHQSPLGNALSLPRRLKLLNWAAKAESWIIEDDYDSEYRYEGHPLPALKSLDQQERVLYIGSFSKVLFPGLRLGYLVVPESLVETFQLACHTTFGGCPWLSQAIVSDLMHEGHFSRHLKKMRSLYAQRRAVTAEALRECLGERLEIKLKAGGMHLLAELPFATDDAAIAARVQAGGLAVQPLSRWCIDTQCHPGLLLGFTNVASREQARQLARKLATLV